ncbi:polyhydroxyalkanoate synthesis regulator DNA-binding domain-containing protein [Methylobacterium frigidaeris]|uniref:polyhydroxyalkanoate synthesis regulator DNA-binding domain-containing protein n=1 Tax=Methylobacterium frigidaeris TaxID=2038277 RepID=UPI0034D97C82
MHRGATISANPPQSVLVLRYAPHRFYDTHARCYVPAEQIRERAAMSAAVLVIDAESAEDVTAALIAGGGPSTVGVCLADGHREPDGVGY